MNNIYGMIRFDGKKVNEKDIAKMLDEDHSFEHDDQGVWTQKKIGFGYKTRWTTQEAKDEKQPLLSEDGNLVLIADARIDNRDELIKTLNLKENNSKIITDLNLILFSYQKWGKDCSNYISGDFSFAIWDNEKNEFFSTRDRFGIKQFYYYYDKNILIFSSSITPLFSLDVVNRKIDIRSVKKYIRHRALDRDESFFEDIKRLPSSSWINITKNEFNIQRYWFPETIKTNTDISLEEATEKFSILFDNAIKSCLRSPYPVSVEVSGGVDSSSIYSAAMLIDKTQPFLAHTIQHKGLPSDETYYIEALEKKFGSEIIKYNINEVNFKKHDLSYFYSKYRDWPQKGNFIEFVEKNKKLNDSGIRVIITGIGADEICGGDDSYMFQYFKSISFRRLYNELYCIQRQAKSKLTFIKYILSILLWEPLKLNIKKAIKYGLSKLSFKNNPYKSTLLLKDVKPDRKVQNSYISTYGLFFLSARFSYWIDFNAMQRYRDDGIEIRHPFFDTKLVEFIISLPPEYLFHCGRYKNILKSAMNGVLPDEILNRNDKTCLGPGIKLQMKKMLSVSDEMLNCAHIVEHELIEDEKIKAYKIKYKNAKINTREFIDYWSIINIDSWINKNRVKE